MRRWTVRASGNLVVVCIVADKYAVEKIRSIRIIRGSRGRGRGGEGGRGGFRGVRSKLITTNFTVPSMNQQEMLLLWHATKLITMRSPMIAQFVDIMIM